MGAPVKPPDLGPPLLYRVHEAAHLLGISTSKAWDLVSRGDIPSVRIDGSRRVSRAALETYAASLAEPGA